MLKIEDKRPLTAEDQKVIDAIEEMLKTVPQGKFALTSAFEALMGLPELEQNKLRAWNCGTGGHHIWISFKHQEDPTGWHRLCIITEREA